MSVFKRNKTAAAAPFLGHPAEAPVAAPRRVLCGPADHTALCCTGDAFGDAGNRAPAGGTSTVSPAGVGKSMGPPHCCVGAVGVGVGRVYSRPLPAAVRDHASGAPVHSRTAEQCGLQHGFGGTRAWTRADQDRRGGEEGEGRGVGMGGSWCGGGGGGAPQGGGDTGPWRVLHLTELTGDMLLRRTRPGGTCIWRQHLHAARALRQSSQNPTADENHDVWLESTRAERARKEVTPIPTGVYGCGACFCL